MSFDASTLHPVLIVASDPQRRRALVSPLNEAGIEVIETTSASAASRVAQQAEPSVIVVAAGTPGVAPETLSAWRASGVQAALIAVVSADAVSQWSEVSGLDEVLIAPFSAEQLLIRVRRHVSRGGASELRLEAGVVDLRRRELRTTEGEGTRLTAREVQVLAFFAAHPSRTIPREVLLTEVWGYARGAVTRAVDQAIRRLRDKVELDRASPRHILTVHGEGYRFEPLEVPAPAPDAPPPPEGLPAQIGRYRVGRILGRGSGGVVVRAELTGPGGFRKAVALKLLSYEDKADGFLDEARVGGRLHHPNIVEVYDVGMHTDGRLWIAMEYVDGASALEVIRSQGRLPVDDALELVRQAAIGVAHAHALQVAGAATRLVHLDLKPGNVLVSRRGEVKVADFGLAQARGLVRRPSRPVGTVGYVAPEILDGQAPDARADVFALGVILACAVLGSVPWVVPDLETYRSLLEHPGGLMGAHPEVGSELESLRRGLGTWVASCLSPDLEKRPYDASIVVDELAALQAQSADLGGRVGSALGQPTPVLPATFSDTAPPRPRTNLEPPRDPFFGRVDQVDDLRVRLKGDTRLITLLGPAGVGKTRLATEVGLADERAGGCWFVDLSEARTRSGLVFAVSRALDSIRGQDTGDQEQLLGRTLAGRGATLVILDNCEGVVADVGPLVERWMAVAPEAVFLATSQERLRIRGEHIVPVGPLTLEEGRDLFVARARALLPDFDADGEGLTELVTALDAMPLALELAAARVRLLPVRVLLERLEDRFRLLADPGSGRTPRHRSLHAAVSASWELLEAWEQDALMQLSVFHGGIPVSAAEAVLDVSNHEDAPWGLFVLESLLDKSFLSHAGTARVGMYSQIRAWCATQAEAHPDLLSDAQQRHAAHFASLRPGPEDLDNLMVAMGQAQAPDLRVRLAIAASMVLYHAGPVSRGARILDEALAWPGITDAHRAELLHRRGEILRLLGDYAGALACQEAGLALDVPGPLRESLRLSCALAQRFLGHHDVAMATLRELAADAEDDQVRIQAVANVAWMLRSRGQIDDEVLGLFERALQMTRDLGFPAERGMIEQELGILRRMRGEGELARAHYERAIAGLRRHGPTVALPLALHNLGNLLEGDEARPYYAEACDLHRDLGRRDYEALGQAALARIAGEAGERQEAHDRIAMAQAALEAQPASPVSRGGVLQACGVAHARLGDVEDARSLLERATSLYEEADDVHQLALALVTWSKVERADGSTDRAEALLDRADALAKELDSPPDGQLRVRISEARAEA